MSMPRRQKFYEVTAPCGAHDTKQIELDDGTIRTIVDDPKLPPSAQFETKNMVKAKIPLDDPRFAEVSTEFMALDKMPSEPTTNQEE